MMMIYFRTILKQDLLQTSEGVSDKFSEDQVSYHILFWQLF
jgi:hypothetical protein